MAVHSMTIDEILTMIADAYDSLIAPKKIWRNDNSKFWLVFKAIAAGYTTIIDAILALHNRFDPLYCADDDLDSTAKMVGTAKKLGSGSLLKITATNNSTTDVKILTAGTYAYTSTSGERFLFTIASGVSFAALEAKVFTAVSEHVGKFLVTANTSITLIRTDNTGIDPSFTFSSADNSGQQGYPDEDQWAFRQRILADTTRQDHLAELQLAIRNLPDILECNIIFNPSTAPVVYDGISIDPYQMLIIVTGSPSQSMADTVVDAVLYHTKMVDPGDVVYHSSAIYIGGQYPVYFTNHGTTDFTLNVTYQYDSQKVLVADVESALTKMLGVYQNSVQHFDILSEEDVYAAMRVTPVTSVKLLNVDILVAASPVPYLSIPCTRMANMTAVTFTAVDVQA